MLPIQRKRGDPAAQNSPPTPPAFLSLKLLKITEAGRLSSRTRSPDEPVNCTDEQGLQLAEPCTTERPRDSDFKVAAGRRSSCVQQPQSTYPCPAGSACECDNECIPLETEFGTEFPASCMTMIGSLEDTVRHVFFLFPPHVYLPLDGSYPCTRPSLLFSASPVPLHMSFYNPRPSTLDPQPSTLNPRPSTHNPKP